jgi:membrane protease YdiL (CAAX protease family)
MRGLFGICDLSRRVVALARLGTLDQWRAIDEQYGADPISRAGAAAVLLTSAVCLVVPRYFGQSTAVVDLGWLARLTASLPYPDLHGHVYWALFKLINYGLLPWLCMRLCLHRPLRDFGVRLIESRGALLTYACMLLVIMPCVLYASTTQAFLRTYPKCAAAGDSLDQLVIWELAYGLQFLMLEVFFRGFMIFALARVFGSLAIFVMVVPYAMIHLGKPLPECLGSILAAVALGTIALRTGSIWGGVAVHCFVAWSMDVLALLQTGRLSALFGS